MPAHRAPIFLVGFMACGKSSVGPVLAARLNRRFIDLDRVIECESGNTIAEIIYHRGEEQFRRLETLAIQQAATNPETVIAPGGGAITRVENRTLMATSGLTVWLDAPFELCWNRIQQDQTARPLAPDEAVARARYNERLPLYRLADCHIRINETMRVEEIAENIIRGLYPNNTHE